MYTVYRVLSGDSLAAPFFLDFDGLLGYDLWGQFDPAFTSLTELVECLFVCKHGKVGILLCMRGRNDSDMTVIT